MSRASNYAERYGAATKKLEAAKLELQQVPEPPTWTHPATRVTGIVHHEGGLQLGQVHLTADEARSLAAWIVDTYGPSNDQDCWDPRAIHRGHLWCQEQPGHFRCDLCQRIWLGEPSLDRREDIEIAKNYEHTNKDPTEFELLPSVKAVEMCPVTRGAHAWDMPRKGDDSVGGVLVVECKACGRIRKAAP